MRNCRANGVQGDGLCRRETNANDRTQRTMRNERKQWTENFVIWVTLATNYRCVTTITGSIGGAKPVEVLHKRIQPREMRDNASDYVQRTIVLMMLTIGSQLAKHFDGYQISHNFLHRQTHCWQALQVLFLHLSWHGAFPLNTRCW